MNYDSIHTIYFLGIGGIGMSALARYFHQMDKEVSGYDKTPTKLTCRLQDEGIKVHYEDDPGQIPEKCDLVIYTPAVPDDLEEFRFLRKTNIPVKKRAEVLGDLSRTKKTIAVAGTHGKTTVSTMIAHLLNSSSGGCNAFLGGISKNYDSNYISSGDNDLLVVEADEFDRSFLQLHPEYEVITSMDADHLDVYQNLETLQNTFQTFISQVKPKGVLLIKKGTNLHCTRTDIKCLSYDLNKPADYYGANIRLNQNRYVFDVITPKSALKDITLEMPGLINVENAVGAIAIAIETGMDPQEIKNAMAGFKGIKRRFDVQVFLEDVVYIDDYAHHPAEIKGFVESVRKLFPNKKILGIFQPHLYSRTRDFAGEFAESLQILDEIILLEIYPAREKPIPGVDSNLLLDKISGTKKSISTKSNILDDLEKKSFDIILTIGAGDIDQLVEPIKNFLQNRLKTITP